MFFANDFQLCFDFLPIFTLSRVAFSYQTEKQSRGKHKMFPAISESVSKWKCSGDWRTIRQIVSQVPEDERRKFSWIWPTEECLKYLGRSLEICGITKILSIGCGSGLFEWILQESCGEFFFSVKKYSQLIFVKFWEGIKVSGLELDKSWWTSSYAPDTFIPLNFTETPINADFLQKCAGSSDFCLMFCYFNNDAAFRDYLRHFRGDFVVIGGPKLGAGIHTDPSPDALLGDKFWELKAKIDVGDSTNIITIYQKLHQK